MGMWKEGMKYMKIDKGPVIFCYTHNPIILNIISKIAYDNHARVFHYIDPDDIMAIPYDVAIIDRNLLTKNAWENYVDWQTTLNKPDDCTFFILDSRQLNRCEKTLNIKTFPLDFKDNFQALYNFLKVELNRIKNQKCKV